MAPLRTVMLIGRTTHTRPSTLRSFRSIRCCSSQRFFSSSSDSNSSKNSIGEEVAGATQEQHEKKSNKEKKPFSLTRKQRRALRLVNPSTEIDDENAGGGAAASEESLAETLLRIKEETLLQDEEHRLANPNPWFTLLTYPSRALWRSSPNAPPDHLLDVQTDIMQNSDRTGKQLRRTYEKIVAAHQDMSRIREQERRRKVNAPTADSADSADSSYTYSPASGNSQQRVVLYKPEYTLSALKYRLVPNYNITKRVLSELQGLLGRQSFRPRKILDVGVGVGSASAAALEFFHQDAQRYNKIQQKDNDVDGHIDVDVDDVYTGVEWVHGIDPSRSMRDASNLLLKHIAETHYKHQTQPSHADDADDDSNEDNHPQHQQQSRYHNSTNRTRITIGESITSHTQSYTHNNNDTNRANPNSTFTTTTNINGNATATGSFDLVLCTHTLSELPTVASSLSMAAIIWEKLQPGGVAVFIEPGTPDGFSSLRSIRSMLLECCPPYDITNDDEYEFIREAGHTECHVIAPCTHNGKCPMERHKKFFVKGSKGVKWDDMEEFEEIDLDNDDYDDEDEDDNDDKYEIEHENAIDDQGSKNTDIFDSAYCSFVHSLPGGGGKQKQGEKFSYLVVQKRVTGHHDESANNSMKQYTPSSPAQQHEEEQQDLHDVNIVDMLSQSLEAGKPKKQKLSRKKAKRIMQDETKNSNILQDAVSLENQFLNSAEDPLGLELVKGDANRKSWGRIVRAPIKKKGHIILDYCGAEKDKPEQEDGRIVRYTISRSESVRSAPGFYAAARKARWGGLWPDVMEKPRRIVEEQTPLKKKEI